MRVPDPAGRRGGTASCRTESCGSIHPRALSRRTHFRSHGPAQPAAQRSRGKLTEIILHALLVFRSVRTNRALVSRAFPRLAAHRPHHHQSCHKFVFSPDPFTRNSYRASMTEQPVAEFRQAGCLLHQAPQLVAGMVAHAVSRGDFACAFEVSRLLRTSSASSFYRDSLQTRRCDHNAVWFGKRNLQTACLSRINPKELLAEVKSDAFRSQVLRQSF